MADESTTNDNAKIEKRFLKVANGYFYIAALIGLVLVLTGGFKLLDGAKRAAFPGLSIEKDSYVGPDSGTTDESIERDNIRRHGEDDILGGFEFLIIGGPVLVWHLRQTKNA